MVTGFCKGCVFSGSIACIILLTEGDTDPIHLSQVLNVQVAKVYVKKIRVEGNRDKAKTPTQM